MKTEWTHHVEWVILLTTMIGGFYLLDGKIERQGERIDRVYDIWVDNQKTQNEMQKDYNNKFYDLLKERRHEYSS